MVVSLHLKEFLNQCRELQIHNIKVVVIGPGAIESSIWDKFEKDEKEEQYKDTEYTSAIKMDGTLKRARSIAIPAHRVAKVENC